MKDKVVVAIGSDHYNTLWLVRSLGMAGFYPIALIISEHNISFVGSSTYCKECHIVQNISSAIECLMSLNIKERVPVIASSDSAARLLDSYYDLLSSKYILHDCEGKAGRITYWMNKENMLKMAEECGLSVPISISINTDSFEILSEIPYPCLVKPKISALSSKNSFRICNDKEDLIKSIKEIRHECKEVIIQELIQKDYEFLIYGTRTIDDEIVIPGGLRKVHICNSLNNMGMMSLAYCTDEIPIQLNNLDNIKAFLKKLDYHGVFSIEFMITKDKAYFLEINLRNDGTVYCTTQAGVNIPYLWSASVYGLDMKNIPRVYKRSRTYGMNEPNYLKYTLKSQSIFQTVKEIIKVDAFSLIKANDMKPLFAKIFPSIFAYRKRL